MSPEPLNYDTLIDALADGTPIDWTAVETRGGADRNSRRYRNLRLVARVAELHRTLGDTVAGDEEAETAVTAVSEIPATWGHLDVRRRLASGAFGDVLLARDPDLDREVALKLVRPSGSAQRSAERLLKEARILARVRHPNVVTIHGVAVQDGRPGLWMELVSGRTLEALVQAGRLGPGEVTAIGVDICRALAAVHAVGLVHGDVKAQNVMREDGTGRIVLMDFGAGRLEEGGTGAVAGTPLYLAPEALAGEPATQRSDTYSLGVLLFHLLTGQYPYSADDIDGLREAHATGARKFLRDLRPDLPARFVAVVERALERDPIARFATAGATERALVAAGSPPAKLGWSIGWWAAGLAAAVVLGIALLRVPAALPEATSIAIMPFSAAGHPDLNGLTRNLVRELQRYDILVKYGATGREDVAPDVSQAGLDVQDVVQGRLSADSMLHVDLARAGVSPRWTKEYKTDMPPMLARTIAADLATEMRLRLRSGAPAGHQTPSVEAYNAYNRGRVLWEARTADSLMQSIGLFEKAAKLDPRYAEPWAGMADAYIALGVPAFGPLSPMEARRLAKERALKAYQIDPDLVEVQTSLAFASFFQDWDWDLAEARFQKAFALNPQYALAHHWYADYLNAMGRQQEAMNEILEAQKLEPLSVIIDRDVAWHYFFQKRYDEAITHLEGTLRTAPNYDAARSLLARALAERGRYAEAIDQLEHLSEKFSRGTKLAFLAYVHAASGNSAEADALMRQKAQMDGYTPPYYDALVYAAEGRNADALTALERAYNEQDSTLVSLYIDPRLERLHAEPRYLALVRKMKYPNAVQP
jgi:tetratricopeptide (TPR) repeat protein